MLSVVSLGLIVAFSVSLAPFTSVVSCLFNVTLEIDKSWIILNITAFISLSPDVTPLTEPWLVQFDHPWLDKYVRYCNLYPSLLFNVALIACNDNDLPVLPIIVSPFTLS